MIAFALYKGSFGATAEGGPKIFVVQRNNKNLYSLIKSETSTKFIVT